MASIRADPGARAGGMTCTSCGVAMERGGAKGWYSFCPHCGCSPEIGDLRGYFCECPPHARDEQGREVICR